MAPTEITGSTDMKNKAKKQGTTAQEKPAAPALDEAVLDQAADRELRQRDKDWDEVHPAVEERVRKTG